MDMSNLATVIGPNILHRRRLGGTDSKSQLTNEAWEAPLVIEVVKELILQQDYLFTVSGPFLSCQYTDTRINEESYRSRNKLAKTYLYDYRFDEKVYSY